MKHKHDIDGICLKVDRVTPFEHDGEAGLVIEWSADIGLVNTHLLRDNLQACGLSIRRVWIAMMTKPLAKSCWSLGWKKH